MLEICGVLIRLIRSVWDQVQCWPLRQSVNKDAPSFVTPTQACQRGSEIHARPQRARMNASLKRCNRFGVVSRRVQDHTFAGPVPLGRVGIETERRTEPFDCFRWSAEVSEHHSSPTDHATIVRGERHRSFRMKCGLFEQLVKCSCAYDFISRLRAM
jgi:hypothetical protein